MSSSFTFAGLKYEKENEQELKDKLDFSKEKPAHYPSNGQCLDYTITVEWANFKRSCYM